MPKPETIAWLRQSAAAGETTSQVLLEVLERLEALESANADPELIDESQTLHTIALQMVDTLELLNVLPEILDTLRRAIREPMEPGPEPIDEAENDRRFHAGIKAIDKAFTQAPPAGLSLIDELAIAIGDEFSLSPLTLRPEARRAVAVIVRRLRERSPNGSSGITANWLEQEAAK